MAVSRNNHQGIGSIFSYLADRDALSLIPLEAFRLEAWCWWRIKILSLVHPIDK
jgi:hypothetical protein